MREGSKNTNAIGILNDTILFDTLKYMQFYLY